MTNNLIITPELLRQLLFYEPETGKLFWRKRPVELFNTPRDCKIWNSNFGNKLALNCPDSSGYLYGKISKKMVSAHRAAWAIHYGEMPKGEIDHINHIVYDNKIINLRDISGAQNKRNASKRNDNISGFTGVYRLNNKWAAGIRVDGKRIYLGSFSDKNDAINCRISANAKYGFHPNHGGGNA